MNRERLTRVLRKMDENGLTQMIVCDPVTIGYLTGMHYAPGERMLALLLRTDGAHRLFLNRLFPAGESGVPVTSFSDTEDGPAVLAEFVEHERVLGIDKEWPSRFLLRLMELHAAASFVNASDCCDAVRGVKDFPEQEALRRASRINDSCIGKLTEQLRFGMTEREAAGLLTELYCSAGAEGVSFDPIVAFGVNGADPHHEPDDTALQPGDPVLLDVGCIANGYCSDMTRTYFTAPPTQEQIDVYELVRAANEAAEHFARPGVRLCDIDAAARSLIAGAGYGEQFPHRLGHFIGLQVHEHGDVSESATETAWPGMAFSIEPGVYLPGKFGVRIEDLVIVTTSGSEILNHVPKTLTVLELPQ